MAKELIISANVHEKKVAILEDGVVTEFYVERRDENQGVVGNLYKGRVMKVLPGMQSAFVDIGLERDAFLYVSDFTEFMEEEDEIDFKEAAEEARPAAAARGEDRSRRSDRGRPPLVAIGAQPAQGRSKEEEAVDRQAPIEVPIEDVVEQLAEIADESVIPPPAPDELDEELTEEELSEQPVEELSAEPEAATVEPLPEGIEVATVEDFVFERVSDDDVAATEAATYPHSVTDDALAREHAIPAQGAEAEEPAEEDEAASLASKKSRRSRSRKKAADTQTAAGAESEAATEEAPKSSRSRKKSSKSEAKESQAASKGKAKATTRRGSRKRGAAAEEASTEEASTEEASTGEAQVESAAASPQFERITDEDREPDPGDYLKDAIVQEKIIEQIHSAEYRTGFSQAEPEPEWRVGSLRSQLADAAGFQRIVDETADASAFEPELSSYEPSAGTATEETPLDSTEDQRAMGQAEEEPSPFRHIGDIAQSYLYDRAAGEAEQGGAGELNEVSGLAPSGGGEAAQDSGIQATEEPGGEAGGDEDREAEVRDRGGRAEFAIRRGGRGRRRRREPQPGGAAAPAETEKAAAPVATEEPDGFAAETQVAVPRRPEVRHDRRQEPQRRPDQAAARRPERGIPTISDLLHEGQEILVQIAKEPIAKKGARITSHIALPGRYLVYMPTVNHVGVSRKIASEAERIRLKRVVTMLREREGAVGAGGFIARTACAGHTEQELADDMRYLLRTWADIRKKGDRTKAPSLIHRDLDLVQRILRDQLSDEFTAIRVDNETEYARIVEFVNRVQPRLVKRVKLYVGDQPILEKYAVQPEIDKAVRPRVWLKSGGYIVINQTEALVAIDVNTGKFVGKSDKLEDTITRTNLEAAKEIVRQVRLRDLGGIIVIDFIDMEERKNRQKVMIALQQELQTDRAPSKILSINDFGLVAITRKRVKQSLERTLCTPCPYCQGAGMVKSPQTICFEILEQAKAISKHTLGSHDVMLRVSPHVAESLRTTEREVLEEIEAYFGVPLTIEADPNLHQEQYDFAVV